MRRQTTLPSTAVEALEWCVRPWFQVTNQYFIYLGSSYIHGLPLPVTESQIGWRVSFFSSNTCILFLAPSTGHPVPKPELIHLLEHGQKLWTGTRGLSHSTSPGRNWQLLASCAHGSLQNVRGPAPLRCHVKPFVGSGGFSRIEVQCASAGKLRTTPLFRELDASSSLFLSF